MEKIRLQLKHFNQETDYSCGPASLKIVFNFFNKECSEQKLIEKTGAMPKKGVQNKDLIRVIKVAGFFYFEKYNSSLKDINFFLKKKLPVIVNYTNPSSGKGHYAVVFGHNIKRHILCLADPINGDDYKLKESEFLKLWKVNGEENKWLLVISRKSLDII